MVLVVIILDVPKGKRKRVEEKEPSGDVMLEASGKEQRRAWEPYSARILSDPSSKDYQDYKRNKIKQDKQQLLMQTLAPST